MENDDIAFWDGSCYDPFLFPMMKERIKIRYSTINSLMSDLALKYGKEESPGIWAPPLQRVQEVEEANKYHVSGTREKITVMERSRYREEILGRPRHKPGEDSVDPEDTAEEMT